MGLNSHIKKVVWRGLFSRAKMDEREDVRLRVASLEETAAAVEEVEFNHEREADDVPLLLPGEGRGRGGRPSCRQEIVDDEDVGAAPDRVLVHLELGLAVFELIGDAISLVRQLSRLPDG